MTTATLRVRRARAAIYGPPVTGIIGIALVAVGIVGLAIGRDTTTTATISPGSAVQPSVPSAMAIPSAGTFALISADGRLYAPADPELSQTKAARNVGHVVGATTSADGGIWLVTNEGRVIGVYVPVLGSIQLRPGAARVVGIAPAAGGRGYRIVTADGHVIAFHAVKRLGVARFRPRSPVVGIAPAAHDGYWIALANGRVYAINAPELGSATLAPGAAKVVAIASSLDGRGYRLATADGHVYSFGLPTPGDPATGTFRSPVVGLASAPRGGYWLATADGKVYAFGAPGIPTNPNRATNSPVVAIIPN